MAGVSPLLAADLLLRGGAALLLLLMAAVMTRDHGRSTAARLGALFALSAAGYALCSSPGVDVALGPWASPLLALTSGSNLAFWLFARALFDDGFRPRPWHGALWVAIVGLALFGVYGLKPHDLEAARRLHLALTLSALGFAGLSVLQTAASWGADLVEARRRLRVVVVGSAAAYIAVNAASELMDMKAAGPLQALVLAAITAFVAWSLLGVGGGAALFVEPRQAAQAPAPLREAVALEAGDAALIVALERAMRIDRLYRQEGQTIAVVARHLRLPEHRLRRLINQRLGHRNFNSFLNGYRIEETMAALADPQQAPTPILVIALDAGFGSLGPFNRAFKAATGQTPTEYRKAAAERPAESAPGRVVSISARRISNSA